MKVKERYVKGRYSCCAKEKMEEGNNMTGVAEESMSVDYKKVENVVEKIEVEENKKERYVDVGSI